MWLFTAWTRGDRTSCRLVDVFVFSRSSGVHTSVVDVDPDTLSLSGQFEEPVLAIHMLGNPARVETPWLLEDSCGAHGAELNGQKTGSIGHCGAFSFFFSHHITTGEGGAITTNDSDLRMLVVVLEHMVGFEKERIVQFGRPIILK